MGAHKHLLQKIDKKKDLVAKSDMHADLKRDCIEEDREGSRGVLQTRKRCLVGDEGTLGEVIGFGRYQGKVLDPIESTRLRKVDKEVRAKQAPIEDPKLVCLTKAIYTHRRRPGKIHKGSEWAGSVFSEQRGGTYFSVKEMEGNGFRGYLHQHGSGGGEMDVEGILQGNAFRMWTTQVLQAANRKLVLTGYLLSDRMLAANVSSEDPGNKPAMGAISIKFKKPPKKKRNGVTRSSFAFGCG